MIVTFCGHGDFRETEEERRKMFGVLEKLQNKEKLIFILAVTEISTGSRTNVANNSRG